VKKVLLLTMPFGALERPALGLSLLKALLVSSGVPCDIRYLNVAFAEFVGEAVYRWMTSEIPYTAFAGDWTFTAALYGERPDVDTGYIQQILRQKWRLDDVAIARLLRVRACVRYFIDHCMASVPWDAYALVGFTSTFEQNIASLALARRIKAAHPKATIVFGGANWEGEMGLELHRQFTFVDYVCSGEAESSFPALVERVLTGEGAAAPCSIPGVVCRVRGESVSAGRPAMMTDMDSLPVPDFSDYFGTLEQSTVGASVIPTLLLETSRGCWWGARSHCTFCGLNGATMTFRSKSSSRALQELYSLVERWKVDLIEVVDNILDMRYFNDFLPALARSGRRLQLFYEVKANLSRRHLEILRAAGVTRIQPGIESLSDHILQLMRKGTSGLRNIQLLKWCQAYGVVPEWNLLYGFPGETREDYEATLALLPSIRFLPPPAACGPVRLDRFSPYFNTPEAFGVRVVRPLDSYGFLYAVDAESLKRIAYFFEYAYEPGVDPTGHASAVIDYVEQWRAEPDRGTLTPRVDIDGSLVLTDTRSEALRPSITLAGPERIAYEYCDELRPIDAVVQHVRQRFPDATIGKEQLRECLDSLVANRVMVTDGVHYLSLADTARLREDAQMAPSVSGTGRMSA
jgi:ribosomal peptide maturation radical SAM protein 1